MRTLPLLAALVTLLAAGMAMIAPTAAYAAPEPAPLPGQWSVELPEPIISGRTSTISSSSSARSGRGIERNDRITDDGGEIVYRDGKRMVRRAKQVTEYEWLFPSYVGNVGLEFSSLSGLDHGSAGFGVFYKHFQSDPGPFYVGFELLPFSFGTVADDDGFSAIDYFQSRAMLLGRVYFDLWTPKIFFEFGLGVHFITMEAVDGFTEFRDDNGSAQSGISRVRLASRLAFGIEFGPIGFEIGWTGLFPDMDFEYNANTATEAYNYVGSAGTVYVAMSFVFRQS